MTWAGAVIPATLCFMAGDSGPFRAASMLSAGVGVWAQTEIAAARKAIRIFMIGQYTPGFEARFSAFSRVTQALTVIDSPNRRAYAEVNSCPRRLRAGLRPDGGRKAFQRRRRGSD